MRIRYAANISTLFTEVPFLERFAMADEAGFTHVEFWFPYDYQAEVLRDQLQAHNLNLVLFNLSPGDYVAGDRGLLSDPTRSDEFKHALDNALEYAQVLGCQRIHAMVGNQPARFTREVTRAFIVENLCYAAPRAADANVMLLIEALNPNDNPGFFLTQSRDAFQIIRDVDAENVKFQFDFYHLQITEGNLTQTFLAHLADIGHVQIADVPGRHQPGTGEINYPFVLKTIEESAYHGFLGIEFSPLGSTDESLAWLPRRQRTILG